jgi:predicted ATP-dependent endonuclease of OLD family
MMKLKYKQDYLSIEKFNDIELADFTVLTGVNGSGKSHLLQAIDQKKVIIEGNENSNIVLFNYETFKLENESSFNAQTISQEREQAWNFFTQNGGGNIKNSIQSWKNNLGANYEVTTSLCKTKNKNLFSLSKKDISDDAIFDQLKSYRQNIKNHFKNNNNLKDNQQAHAILTLIKKLSFSLDEIEKEDFLKLYKPFHFKNDFLPQQLGKIIWDYYIRYDRNQYNEYENNTKGKNYPVLSDSDFIKIYGDKPWEVINNILSSFDSLKYKINSPEGTDCYSSFQLKLIHANKDLEIGFEHLSSGERTLMALVASIYKSSSDNHFPDILLLDEIDASLHPSMMRNLLSVINDIFIEKNVKVILVTHSPSTIALAPEKSIFVMNENGGNRIEKSSKENALEILTDGFASLSPEESNLGISYNISKSDVPILFTEGITDKIILETAWKKLNKTRDMPFYVQDSFDASFLGNLFRRGDDNQEGIFEVYSDKKFIALFDFDFAGYSQWNGLSKFSNNLEMDPVKCLTKKHESREVYAILLPVPDSDIKNQVIDTGDDTFKDKSILDIELLFYGITSLKSFFITEKQVGRGKVIKFSGRKKKFAEKVNELSDDDFKNFKPLLDKIEELFGSKHEN